MDVLVNRRARHRAGAGDAGADRAGAGRRRSTPRCSACRPTPRCRAPTASRRADRARRAGAAGPAQGRDGAQAARAAGEGGARAGGARRPRDHRRLRASGRHHRRRPTCSGAPGCGASRDALLKSNLSKSHSPYYLMSQLARQRQAARRQGRGTALVRSRRSTRSEGPGDAAAVGRELPVATLVDLAPQDVRAHREGGVAADRRGGTGHRALSTSAALARCSAWAASSARGTATASMPRSSSGCKASSMACAPRLDAGERAACDGLLKKRTS